MWKQREVWRFCHCVTLLGEHIYPEECIPASSMNDFFFLWIFTEITPISPALIPLVFDFPSNRRNRRPNTKILLWSLRAVMFDRMGMNLWIISNHQPITVPYASSAAVFLPLFPAKLWRMNCIPRMQHCNRIYSADWKSRRGRKAVLTLFSPSLAQSKVPARGRRLINGPKWEGGTLNDRPTPEWRERLIF